jgi:hypothetical protein
MLKDKTWNLRSRYFQIAIHDGYTMEFAHQWNNGYYILVEEWTMQYINR